MKSAATLEQIDAAAARWVARRDAGLTTAERREFERWRMECPLHAEAVASYERSWQALGRPRRTGAGEILAAELRSLLGARRWRRLVVATAAVLMLAIGGFAWWNMRLLPPNEPWATRHTVVLAPERRVLPDGTVVENPSDSVVELDYSPAARRVVLRRGAAHFAVARDPARPFLVGAGGLEIRAVGTAFSVQLGQSQLEVLVTEGKVEVDRTAPEVAETAPAPLAIVNAGQRLRVKVALQPVAMPTVEPVKPADVADRLAWRSTRVEFSSAPLAEVVAVLNRYHQTKFVLGDPTLATVPLSGLFRADDADLFIALLKTGFGIVAEPQNGQWVLRRAPCGLRPLGPKISYLIWAGASSQYLNGAVV